MPGFQRQHVGSVFVRDAIALGPALDRGVISMAQLSGYRSDTATCADDLCIGHTHNVRAKRTYVNVESVQALREKEGMADKITIGERLLEWKQLSGLSLVKIAKAAGYEGGGSSVQRYFNKDYDPDFLPRDVAEKLAGVFGEYGVGKGDVLALAGLPTSNATIARLEGGADVSLPRDIPVHGTALGAPREFDGHAIEQTMLNSADPITYIPRPPALNRVQGAYALYVQGSSMAPRFEDGETIYVTDSRSSRPPMINDDVVLYLRHPREDDDGERSSGVMVKRLIRRTAAFYELRQFSPEIEFKVPVERVVRVDRVMPWSEIFS